jgi:hypothetical protein
MLIPLNQRKSKMSVEPSVINVVSISLTLSSILIGAATFLLGFYISDRNRGVPKDQRNPFKYIVLSLIIPSYAIIAYSIIILIQTEVGTSFGMFAVFCSFISLIPVVAINAVILLNWN